MRITGGQFSGRTLQMPRGPRIRPTQDLARQGLFHILGKRVEGAEVLDLFSGSGSLGMEAFSRGAARVTFVDRSPFCIAAVRANLERLSLSTLRPSPFTLRRADALGAIRWLASHGRIFDLIFLDPPYGEDLARKSLIALGQRAIISPSGWVVAEHHKRDLLPAAAEGEAGRLVAQRIVSYGDTALTIYQRQ